MVHVWGYVLPWWYDWARAWILGTTVVFLWWFIQYVLSGKLEESIPKPTLTHKDPLVRWLARLAEDEDAA